MERIHDVAIAGGGIGGLTLALALANRGVSVTVLEQASTYKPIYRGEYLQPRSQEIFDELGIGATIEAVTVPVYVSRAGTEDDGVLMDVDTRSFGALQGRNGFHRDIHGAVLAPLRRLSNVEVRMGARVVDVKRESETWSIEMPHSSLRARILVGADGRGSRVRERLGIVASERRYPGAVLAVTVQLDDEPEACSENLLGTHESGLFFPLPNRKARLYLLVHEDERYAWIKSQPDRGLSHVRDRLRALFPRLASAVARIGSLSEFQNIPAYHLTTDRWVVDHAALIGDAIHCVHPALGQGMNLAIADAAELARVLAHALEAGRTDAETLREYESARRSHVTYIQKDGDRSREMLLRRDRMTVALRNRVFRNGARAQHAMRRMHAVYAGVEAPPSPLEETLLSLALVFPSFDRVLAR
ncbi:MULTISPECIES: FAD-dependent oxidoreductase [Sandaracinus]|uniref:FAD-dependent oxidoreductase n=1 Tax=Sandaracinus TaxID=1055688 RepID=UPI0019D4D7EE|nr:MULTISPECIES: NAD(P)/FAD-dependent oxidoreductase [Sandaracinus]QRN75764.1 FAD binding monooxygenase [Sandaracinus sp.]UJR87264.1 Hypothetical protein I5071_560 [Sandaracinus amylolyticus]